MSATASRGQAAEDFLRREIVAPSRPSMAEDLPGHDQSTSRIPPDHAMGSIRRHRLPAAVAPTFSVMVARPLVCSSGCRLTSASVDGPRGGGGVRDCVFIFNNADQGREQQSRPARTLPQSPVRVRKIDLTSRSHKEARVAICVDGSTRK
jgi:hypothetical protein